MELKKVSDRIWYSVYEEERDRPCLGYVRGDQWSVAVDAGHSDAHVEEFYDALKNAGLPLPVLTVITHWHWDHSFGMHRIHGLSIANKRTSCHLKEYAAVLSKDGPEAFLSLDPSIQKEYAGGRPVVVVLPEIVFDEDMSLNPGGVTARLFTCTSPHTDDTTLIYIPEEKFLFVGDCICGEFPTWESDPIQTSELVNVLEGIDAEYCLGGHWPLYRKKQLLEALAEGTI